jgi:hypothetical protein
VTVSVSAFLSNGWSYFFCGRGRFDPDLSDASSTQGGGFSSFGGLVPGVMSPVVVLNCGVRCAQ